MKSPLIQLGVAALGLLVVSVGTVVWYGVLSEKSATVASIETQIVTKMETAKRVTAARAALSELSGSEAAVRAYFVSESGIVGFIDSLQTLGTAQGAQVAVLSVSASQTATHPSLELSLSVKGPFDSVMRAVGAIEYAPYDIVLTNLSVVKEDSKTWMASVKLLVGSGPVRAVPSVSTGGAQPTATASTSAAETTTRPTVH